MALVDEIVVSTTTVDAEEFQTSPEEGLFGKNTSEDVAAWLKLWLVFLLRRLSSWNVTQVNFTAALRHQSINSHMLMH